MDCEICKRKHPTLLHNSRVDSKQQTPLKPTYSKEASVENALVSTNHATGASKSCAMPIVPFQVEAAKGSKVIQT